MRFSTRLRIAAEAFRSGKMPNKYVTTPILGGVNRSPEDIRADKFGAAFIILFNVPAQRCVAVRMDSVGTAKWKIVNRQTDEEVASSTDPKDHPVATAIIAYQEKWSEPLFARWEQALCVAGMNFVQLVRNPFRFPTDLEWLNPLSTEIIAPSNIIQGYRYSSGAEFEHLKPKEVAYDRNPSNLFSDIYGWSPLMSATTTANIMRNSGRVLSAYFRNDARPGAIGRPKDGLGELSMWDQGTMDQIRQAISDNHKGADNAFNMALFPVPIDIEVFDQPDLQHWAELVKTTETDIYTAFGVPRSIAGDSDSTRYDSSPDDVPRYGRLIKSELQRIQDAFNAGVMPFFDPAKRERLDFDTSDFEVIPPESVQAARDQLGSGIITLNEARRQLGHKERENGDVFYLPASSIVVPSDQLSVVQSKPTYLILQNPQGTVEQAAGMAQAIGVDAPTPPVPTQPAPNLTAEDIAPGTGTAPTPALPSGTAPANPVEAPDPFKDIGQPLFVGLSLASNNAIIGLQRQLMTDYPDEGIEWVKPEEYHVTLIHAEVADEESARDFAEAVAELPVPELSLRLGQLNSFDNLGKHSMHLRVRRNAELREYQAAVYDIAEEFGIVCSQFSDPAAYIPHITLAYLPGKVSRIPFDTPLTVSPDGAWCDYGEETLWRSSEEIITVEPEEQLEEFKAWRRYAKNRVGKANPRPFEFKAIPEAVQHRINEETVAGKSAEEVYDYLLPLITGMAPLPYYGAYEAESTLGLNENVRAYIDHLKAWGVETAEGQKALEKHYLRLLAAKAIQATRLDFEDKVEALLAAALGGNTKKAQFRSRLRNIVEVSVRKAALDGLEDGGITDPEMSGEEIDWLDEWQTAQREYIDGLTEAIYEDDRVTEAEATGKPAMWWNKSIAPVYAHYLASASKNAAFMRVLGRTIEHCDDCPKIDGQVRRASFWEEIGIWNASDKTQCGGWRCECKNVPTDAPLSKGKFPKLAGPGSKSFSPHVHVFDHSLSEPLGGTL